MFGKTSWTRSMEQREKQNELMRVYVEDGMIYAQPKAHCTDKELFELVGILQEFIEFVKGQPEKREGKQKWVN